MELVTEKDKRRKCEAKEGEKKSGEFLNKFHALAF